MEKQKKESKRELISLLVFFMFLGVMIIGIQALIYWGIGYFVCWAFGLSLTWTFWHGLAIAFIITVLKNIFSNFTSKE